MKLFEIEFQPLYVEASSEQEANEKVYEYLQRISANDLEKDASETSTDYINLVELINEK